MILSNKPAIFDVDAIGALLAVASAVAAVMLWVAPALHNAGRLGAVQQELENKQSSLERIDLLDQTVQTNIDVLQQRWDSMSQNTVSESRRSDVIADMGTTAEQYGWNVLELRPVVGPLNGPYRTVTVTIKARASYPDVMAFVHAMRGHRTRPVIQMLRIESDPAGHGDLPVVQCRMYLHFFTETNTHVPVRNSTGDAA